MSESDDVVPGGIQRCLEEVLAAFDGERTGTEPTERAFDVMERYGARKLRCCGEEFLVPDHLGDLFDLEQWGVPVRGQLIRREDELVMGAVLIVGSGPRLRHVAVVKSFESIDGGALHSNGDGWKLLLVSSSHVRPSEWAYREIESDGGIVRCLMRLSGRIHGWALLRMLGSGAILRMRQPGASGHFACNQCLSQGKYISPWLDRAHPHRHVEAAGHSACVDEGLADLIAGLWSHGVGTSGSCQGGPNGDAWIQFPTEADFHYAVAALEGRSSESGIELVAPRHGETRALELPTGSVNFVVEVHNGMPYFSFSPEATPHLTAALRHAKDGTGRHAHD